jgi:hypothetical protein
MKNGIAYFLLGLYLCVSTEAYQLLKVPLLITHFIKHYQLEPDTTLKGFLAEHYSSETVYDEDWQQDMELPFKCCECIQFVIPATLRAEILVLPVPKEVEINIVFTPRIDMMLGKLQESKIFQPPRIHS